MANSVNNMALIAPFFLFFLAVFFFFLVFFFFFSPRFCLTVKGCVGSSGVGSSVVSPFGSLVAGSGIALMARHALASVKGKNTAQTRTPGLFLSVAITQPPRLVSL